MAMKTTFHSIVDIEIKNNDSEGYAWQEIIFTDKDKATFNIVIFNDENKQLLPVTKNAILHESLDSGE